MLDLFNMKCTDFNKLRAVATAWPSEAQALFSNEFTSIPQCLAKECQTYHGHKEQGSEIYTSNGNQQIPSTSPAAAVIEVLILEVL